MQDLPMDALHALVEERRHLGPAFRNVPIYEGSAEVQQIASALANATRKDRASIVSTMVDHVKNMGEAEDIEGLVVRLLTDEVYRPASEFNPRCHHVKRRGADSSIDRRP